VQADRKQNTTRGRRAEETLVAAFAFTQREAWPTPPIDEANDVKQR